MVDAQDELVRHQQALGVVLDDALGAAEDKDRKYDQLLDSFKKEQVSSVSLWLVSWHQNCIALPSCCPHQSPGLLQEARQALAGSGRRWAWSPACA